LVAVAAISLFKQVIILKFSLDAREDRVELYLEARPAVTGSHRLPPRDRKAGDEAHSSCEVADPDPWDPNGFGPLGSGSISQRSGSLRSDLFFGLLDPDPLVRGPEDLDPFIVRRK
jgi:hypothetical protein